MAVAIIVSPKISPHCAKPCQNDGTPLISPGNQLKQEMGAVDIDRHITDLIYDQQFGKTVELEFLLQTVPGICLDQGSNKSSGRGKERPVLLLDGLKPQSH